MESGVPQLQLFIRSLKWYKGERHRTSRRECSEKVPKWEQMQFFFLLMWRGISYELNEIDSRIKKLLFSRLTFPNESISGEGWFGPRLQI